MNCQDYIKDPKATEESIAAYQARYAKTIPNDKAILPRLRGPVPRIAYHCSFMDSDTIRYQLAPALRERDRKAFELVGYAPSFPNDMGDCFDIQINTSKFTDAQFTRKVRSDSVDILIELSGFSRGHRFGAMARRAAPIQVSYLNHPGTSGIPNVDYIVTDRAAFGTGDHYTEKPCYIDGCFFCFDYRRSIYPPLSQEPFARNGFITYGSMGSLTKINREIVRLWSRILIMRPDSRFRLQNEGMHSWLNRAKIRHWFKGFGVDASRIDLVPGVSRYSLLAAYSQIDVQLDTWPYCGGNTIAESFWMGVPVITLQGNRFASSYGASLVRAAGYPELVTHSADEYVGRAVSIKKDWLMVERSRAQKKGFMLWDSRAFASKLEKMYGDLCAR